MTDPTPTADTPTMHVLGHDIPITPDLQQLASFGMAFPDGIGLRALAWVLSEHGSAPREHAVRTALARAVCLLAEDGRDRLLRDAIAAGVSARADSTPAVVHDLVAMWEALQEADRIRPRIIFLVEFYADGSGRMRDGDRVRLVSWDDLPGAAPAIRAAVAAMGGER